MSRAFGAPEPGHTPAVEAVKASAPLSPAGVPGPSAAPASPVAPPSPAPAASGAVVVDSDQARMRLLERIYGDFTGGHGSLALLNLSPSRGRQVARALMLAEAIEDRTGEDMGMVRRSIDAWAQATLRSGKRVEKLAEQLARGQPESKNWLERLFKRGDA